MTRTGMEGSGSAVQEVMEQECKNEEWLYRIGRARHRRSGRVQAVQDGKARKGIHKAV